MTQILEHLFSNLTSGEVSKRCHFSLEIFKLSTLQRRGPINYRISHGIDHKLNEIKHSAQLVTLSAQRLAYGLMPLELAETRPRSNFPESRNAFSKVRSAKLNTDVNISMAGTDYFGETALKQGIIHLSTPCGNHTITHFRCTVSGLHRNLNRQQNHTFFADR